MLHRKVHNLAFASRTFPPPNMLRLLRPTTIARLPATRCLATSATPLARTGLYDYHLKNAAKMVPFAGYEMPLSYGDVGQVASHLHVRSYAGLFDVGHMVQSA